ncbi:exopolyphosphatase [Mucilaginibacter limnophilus]|uniref:Exopolyphosphatase n=1 Tax=Mucilaginibacter limnophilus TaxID=1932778 RepID=A0A3S2X0N5_9SPHI|nr:exopolyphosphatase [Mucilaginibacter limnophilus]RVU02665.1 exopolyphosphatase [Mucilaginibacter limnophilus]
MTPERNAPSITKTTAKSGAQRVAVMDLGTNTFHLLITEGTVDNLNILIHEHVGVKLGEGGINKGYIHADAYKRGIDTMVAFQNEIERYNAAEVRAIATSALRNASNGQDFVNEVQQLTGIQIETINGDREAELIYQGIKAAGCLNNGLSLIMDIGGGSVEFILGDYKQIVWKQSFEIGAARLMDKFHKIDPIPNKAIYELNRYLENNLDDLFSAVDGKQIDTLIGSSGSYETFAELTEMNKGHAFDLNTIKNYSFNTQELVNITDWLVSSSHQERKTHDGIDAIRVDMIVVASLITRFVMDKLDIKQVAMSTYSLKEGVLAEMLNPGL